MLDSITLPEPPAPAVLAPAGRDYVQIQVSMLFSTLTTVAEGVTIKTWARGPHQGQPEVSQVGASLVALGLCVSTRRHGGSDGSSPTLDWRRSE